MARICCNNCGSELDENWVEDLDLDQCPDCGRYTSFEVLDDDEAEVDAEDDAEDSDEDSDLRC